MEPFGILVTGIGGTGVVTVGQILAVAAHVEGKGALVLDMSGLAQKGGPVMSHVRLADKQSDLHSTRVGTGNADLVIGCDQIVTAGGMIAKVTKVEARPEGLVVSFEGGSAPATDTFDRILVAVGRRPNGGALDADSSCRCQTPTSRTFPQPEATLRKPASGAPTCATRWTDCGHASGRCSGSRTPSGTRMPRSPRPSA